MGKKLTPQQREELRANMQTLIDDGKDESIVSKYRDSYIDKYGTDDLLKKKVDSQPSVSPSKPKVTQPFSLLESSGNVSYTGGLIEDYNAKVKEQERLKKEETTKKLGSLNIDFAKTGLDIKAIGNEIKTKLKNATIGEIEAFNEVITENTKKNGTSYLGFKQSSIGKANELISDVKNGIELSQEDEAYLKQTSPKAYNELLSSSNVISVDVNSIARQKKKEKQELFSFSANQDMVQSANDLRQLGIDVNNISANKAVQELAKVESYYSAKLNELNVKYPEKVSGYTGSVYKDNYNPIVKRDDAYAEEKAKLDEQYNGVKERIGKLNAYQYALKNKNADVESVGEEVLKVADPIRYNNFVKGGKKSADVKEDLHNLGYHILQSTNDAELINKGRNAEQEHDNKYPNQLIQETKKRIASEYVKSIGGEDYVANKGSLSIEEADKFIDQLPQKYKKAYLEKIRPYAINQNGVTSSITDVNDANFNPGLYTNKELSPRDASIELPNLGGAVNKFIQGYTQPIEGVFNFALDRLDSDGKVNRALEKPKMYEQELAKSKELKDQINQLKAKPKLTVQEATELSQKQQELQVQKPFKEVVDGSFSLLGQVIGQAALSEVGTPFVSSALNGVKIGTKTIGFTDKANKIATYASEIKNIKGASASMVAYASSYSDAEKEAINLGLDGWKKALYSNVIAGLNAGTERIFKDEKVLDAFNAEVSPLIGDMIQNLTTRGVTDAVLSRELRTIITKTLPKFAKNMVVENQKEAGEELATQLGTSIIKGLLAPDQFNTQEELDAMKQVWYETTIYGGITSFGAAVTETRNSNVSKKAMYELGSNNAEINKFIDVVNTQVSKGKMSQEDANDKIKAVNTMQQIVQKSIPLIDSKRKLTSSEKVKLSNILLAERKLQDEIKNPNFSDVKSLNEKELSKVQDLKNKILNNEVFIDDNLDVYTEDEYNAKRDAENATPSNKIIQYNNDGTLTIKDANGVFIENFNGTIDEYYKKQVESTAKAEIEKIQEEIDSYDEEYNGLVDLVNKEDRKLNTPKSENEIKLNQLQNKIQKLRDRRDKLKSEPLLSNEQPISTTQSGSNPTTLKNGDKYTDAKGVERIWGENTEADKTHEIEQMLKATAEGAAMGATIQSVEDFKSGKETIFRKPQSIEAAKNNPNYNVEIQSDGSAKVIGVLDPRNNEWVGKSPSTKSENSKVTIDNIDELLKNDVARLQISSDGNKVDFNMFDVVIDRESNTAEVSFIEKKNRDKNKGIGVLAYIELAKKLNEQGISLVTSGNNPKMIGGDSIWNKLTKLGITERYGNKGNKINIDKLLEQQTTSTTQSESSADEIERRRPTAYIRDSKDKKSSLETFRNEAKREWDGVSVITGDRMKNLYVGIQLFVEAYPEYKELLNKFIKKENGTIGITNNNLSFVLNTLKKQGVTTESELGSKINAKYDAELDALKSKLTPVSAKEQIESANVQLDEVQSIQSQIDELVAKRKAEYDNALVGKENLSQTVKDNLNKKISANYNPQIDVLQKRLDEIAKNNVEAKVESNPTTTESKSTDADNALEQQPTSTTQSESNSALKSFNSVPKVSNTKEEGQKAQEQVFSIASNLGVGTVIKNGDGIQIVTENSISKNGRHTIGITEFERQEDGSLIQTGDTQFVTKNNEGQIKSDYNPHTTYTNSKGERVTETAEITTDKIDLSKEKVFVNSNDDIVESKAFSTTGVQEAPKTGQQPISTQSGSNPASSDVEQFNRAKEGSLKRIKNSNDPQTIFSEINRLQETLKKSQSFVLTPEEQTLIDKKLKELKDKGYSLKTKKGEILRQGDQVRVDDNVTLLKASDVTEVEKSLLEKELNRRNSFKQELIKNGYSEQEATIEAGLSPEEEIYIVSQDIEVAVIKNGVQEKSGKVAIRFISIEAVESLLSKEQTPKSENKKVDVVGSGVVDMWKLTQEESFKANEDTDSGEGVRTHEEMATEFLSGYKNGKEGLSVEGNSVVFRNKEGKPIGFAHFDKDGVREIGVDKSERGNGIASKMIDYLKQEKGIDKVLPPFSKEGNILSHRNEVKKAIAEGKYQKAISEGRMTANDAKAIIESAGLEVPKEIESLLSKEQTPPASDVESTAKALEGKDIEIEIPISKITETQSDILTNAIERVKEGKVSKSIGSPEIEIRDNGLISIQNGNHRIAKAIIDGKETIKVKVLKPSEAYHKGKAKPESTRTEQEQELVKAVEELLAPAQPKAETTPAILETPIAEVKVKSFKQGDGGTKGVFEGEDGKLYKSIEPQEAVQDKDGNFKRQTIKDKLTDEHEILSDLQDNPHIPKVGKIVNTTEGKAFEIEKLDEVDTFTKDEYREIQKILNALNDKGYHVGDKVTVMKRPKTGELVIVDFSAGYKGSRMSRDADEYMQNVKEKLSNSDKINIEQEDKAENDRFTAEVLGSNESTTEYYLTRRPPSIGTHPIEGLNSIEETTLRGKKVWKLSYDRKLPAKEIENFELTPKITNKEFLGQKIKGIFGNGIFYVSNIDYDKGDITLVSELKGKEISINKTFREFQKGLDEGRYKVEQTPTASDVESVAKDNDTEESIKEKLKNPFGKKVVIEGVEYTITDVGRGAGSPDITLTDKDGNIFYEEQKTFDGRIIKKLPTKSTLIDIAKNQKPTENLAEQAAETPEQSIKEIELKRDSDVRELSKYRIEINLPTIKEIVNSKDPIGNKWKYSAIKEKITMLDKLINCL